MITIRVQPGPFDLATETTALTAGRTDIGAIVSFTGLVRDHPLTLEHYPAMTEKALHRIANEATARWPLHGLTIIHRFGPLLPADPIVLVLTASAHRAAAFESAMFLMDWLKTCAPFWKKSPEGWVEAKTDDDAAAQRWHSPLPFRGGAGGGEIMS
ncbi:molybdenum cofactor biosynthesis protein MoaE [Sandaracinobacteroides saxicola]|uniref:Molybdopterin synthase catalytic subunit n=1 Tax=Sandaracinobacteroides saxicola TaxID=2759707 RepID=A0A7G5ILN6_9SPHN|nr:molybdenum cofactor biosynthesis protein MoaE [Sandaracinobacteroides saxicola]QMW24278.1 molybdenum cofactor biosynthesis protein MoaE [Sandaracinobacteroides saxicola]